MVNQESDKDSYSERAQRPEESLFRGSRDTDHGTRAVPV